MTKSVFIFSAVIALFFSCRQPELPAVASVSLENYMGTWYEIASLPESNKKGCRCASFDFKLSPEGKSVMVINSCMKKGKQGAVLAKASVDENSGNSKWKIQYFWPFRESYYILDLADDYSFAMAGNPDRKKLWLMSRTTVMDDAVYNRLVKRADELGFDTTKLARIVHDCGQY